MKRALMLAAALAMSAASADARIITYTWHQTSTTLPGLLFSASYGVEQGSAPLPANSYQNPADFGGLVAFSVSGGGYANVTLADLIPACDNPSGCGPTPCGDPYGCAPGPIQWNFPVWHIAVPDFYYIDPTGSWDYQVSATTMQINDDNGASPCFEPGGCFATGFWTSNFVPEPGSLMLLLGGLLAAGLERRRRG